MEREALTIMKACEVVGVSRRTIYNWIKAGKVEYTRTAGGSIRIFADSLWRSSGPRAVQPRPAPMFDDDAPFDPADFQLTQKHPAGCAECGVPRGGHLRNCTHRDQDTGPRSSTTRAEVGATLPRADVNGQAPPDSRNE
jgi:excisionase family DNA binding protein